MNTEVMQLTQGVSEDLLKPPGGISRWIVGEEFVGRSTEPLFGGK